MLILCVYGPRDISCTVLDCCKALHNLFQHFLCPHKWGPDSIFYEPDDCPPDGSAPHKSVICHANSGPITHTDTTISTKCTTKTHIHDIY